jgi:filamentous hemagglutinin family protein
VSSLVIGGALIASSGDCAFAQIVPDTTLGNESSTVTRVRPTIDQINGGATRGANLFHSFQEFNIGEGRSAYFTNSAGIENILTRVTGTNSSNILGTLGVTGGNANLFLINPNGIIFGQNASLDVGGSFTATTANAIKLGDTGLFSASEPATSNLLTVRPSALFFNAVAPGAIVNQSQAQSLGGQTNSLGGPVGLQVPAGKTLALVGGNVAIEGGNLTAAGGRIELGSVAGVGEVSLSQVGNRWLFGYDNINAFGNIRLEGGALVDASGEGGGDVQIQGAQLEMTQGSVIYANTLGSGDGGEILVRTTETVAVRDGSQILATVFGSGTGGDLTILTGRLLVRDGAQVGTGTFRTGAGGTLSVTASDSVEVIGTIADGRFASRLTAQTQGEGDAGNLTIATGRLLVRDGAQVSASTFRTGAGGTLSVTASDTVELIGTSANGQLGSGLFTQTYGDGDAGNLTIATGRLLVRDGAQVSANTRSTGKGGTLSVTASNAIEVIGAADVQFPTGLLAGTIAEGDAGDLTIITGRLLVRDGAQVSASTFSTGAGGTLSVTASDKVEVIGTLANGQAPSGLFTQTFGDGDANDLTIATGQLVVRDGAQVSAGTSGTGNGGKLSVTASDAVEVIGASAALQFTTGLFSATEGEGDAGDLTIVTGRMLVRDGAQVSASTFRTGEGGTLSVTASDKVEVIGTLANGRVPSGLFAATEGEGNAGDLTIATGRLVVRDGAQVSASTESTGNGGTLSVTASDKVEVIGESANGRFPSALFTQTEGEGNAGDLTIATGRLLVRGALVSARTLGTGQGGTLSVTASDAVEVIGTSANGQFPSALTAQTTGAGNARDLTIATEQLTIRDGAEVNVSSTNTGIAGVLRVEADAIRLDNQGKIRADTSGGGGNINLSTGDLILRRGSSISTNARGRNITGGNITIDTDNLVAVPKEDSDISANAQESFGGRVIVNASGIFGTQFRPQDTPLSDITASSALGPQFNGLVQLNTPGIDPSRGLANLPTEVVDASNQIAQTCGTGGREVGKNEFIVTGRRGMPSNPYEPLSSDQALEDIHPPAGFSSSRNSNPDAAKAVASQSVTSNAKPPIVEAQGWVINDKGQVVLTATASTATPHNSWLQSATCPSS